MSVNDETASTDTTDLMARLRLLADHYQGAGFWPDDTMRKAADEIGRLRDLVRHFADQSGMSPEELKRRHEV